MIDADAARGTFEMASSTDASGFPDLSGERFEGIEPIQAEFEPGDSFEGQLVFQVEGDDVYYLQINERLLASDSVLNDARFTFSEEKIE